MDLKERIRRFNEWKRQPHQVAPLSDEAHDCPTCGTHYEGNYCPRCGQSAHIGRYSFKKALLLFLDVWGMGNRGMFRTIRDLLLRPGYMIRDYLRGMQMAYFPPFKMFFLLVALSILIDSGLNIRGANRMKENNQRTEQYFRNLGSHDEVQEQKTDVKTDQNLSEDEKHFQAIQKEADNRVEKLSKWAERNTSFILLAGLLFFTLPLWLLFRHCPAIPDLRLSECFVAIVYIANMLTIFGIIPSLLCFSLKAEMYYDIIIMLVTIIPLKQLSGYSYPSTVWRVLAAFIPFVLFIILFSMLIGIVMYLHALITMS